MVRAMTYSMLGTKVMDAFVVRRLAILLLGFCLITWILLSILAYLTRIKIQRIGFFSLVNITVCNIDGLKVRISSVKLRLRRPNSALTTWLTVEVRNPQVEIDASAKHGQTSNKHRSKDAREATLERISRQLHGVTQYPLLKLIDVQVVNTEVIVKDCATIKLERLSIHLVRKRVEHARSASQVVFKSDQTTSQGTLERSSPTLEIALHTTCLSIAPADSRLEVFDYFDLALKMKFDRKQSVNEVAITCKLGKLDLVVDELRALVQQLKAKRSSQQGKSIPQKEEDEKIDAMHQPVLANILALVSELKVHFDMLQISHTAHDVNPAGQPVNLTASSKDIVVDFSKLPDMTPEFRTLFQPGILAHQGLLSAINISVDLTTNDDVRRLLMIPMLTTSMKTSYLDFLLFNKHHNDVLSQLNINTVITSPSVDLHVDQLPILLALMRPGYETNSSSTEQSGAFAGLTLPRTNLGFNVHDPSFRIVLQSATETLPPMIVGRLASIALDTTTEYQDDLHHLVSSLRLIHGRMYYHSSKNEECNIMRASETVLELSGTIQPLSEMKASGSVTGLEIHLIREEVVQCLADIVENVRAPPILPAKLPRPLTHPPKTPVLDRIPEWLQFIRIHVKQAIILTAASDPEVSPDVRGIKVAMEDLMLTYQSALLRNADDDKDKITEDEPLSRILNDSRATLPNYDTRQITKQVVVLIAGFRIQTIDSFPALDKAKPVLRIPALSASVLQSESHERLSHHVTVRVKDIILGFSLFKVYAILQALQVVRKAFLDPGNSGDASASQDSNSASQLEWTSDLKVGLVRLKSCLPLEQTQLLDLDKIHVSKFTGHSPLVQIHYIRLYAESQIYKGKWDRILSLRTVRLAMETYTARMGSSIVAKKSTTIRVDGLRIRIPHNFVFYKLLEALINSVKTSVQIVHRFLKRTNDYIIAQEPKTPKEIPRIKLKARIMTIELEDEPFESRLGLIFRVGLSEQRMREEREAAFDRKIVTLRQARREEKSLKHKQSFARSSANESIATSSDRPSTLVRQFTQDSKTSRTSDSVSESVPELDYHEERQRLLKHNSRAWILRFRYAARFRAQTMQDIRTERWGHDDITHSRESPEQFIDLPSRPPLFAFDFTGLDLLVDRPSFPLDELPDYLHRVGRGMPKNTKYSLLIPVNLKWKMDEARAQIRDYPLPLLHIPPLHNTQKSKHASWDLSTDLVIAEEFPDYDAIRHIDVCVIPKNTGRSGSPAFSVEVQRTANAVKTYAEMNIDLNSSLPTRVHWGTSMQAAISDVARLFETLSKPQQDPSPKLGFWDKIGLVMHTSLKLNWLQDGDMHVTIKGSRDPYVVIGSGAGLSKVFRGNVRWEIGVHPDSRRLIDVKCDEYMLAIPDFSRRAIDMDSPKPKKDPDQSLGALHHHHLSRKEISFQKILMKLTGKVHWTAGLAFERHCSDECKDCSGHQCRLWDFLPHWEVKMRIPEYSILPGGKLRDAFKDYRSHHIHGQISVTSEARDGEEGYNSIHLSPKAFAHFFDWLHSFSGNLSLPIRNGSLFPTAEEGKQKFGQHLRTLKYNLTLEPLYLSHVYRASDLAKGGKIDITGVKAKIDRFVLDVHQRKEERVVTNKTLEVERKSSHMALYRGRVDLDVTDLRALTAEFENDPSAESHAETHHGNPLDEQDDPRFEHAARLGEFDVAQSDIRWIDMDDFVELDNILPQDSPRCRIIPLAYAPKFVYDRDTTQREGSDHETGTHKIAIPGQRFGFEKTHKCSMIMSDGRSINEDFGHSQRDIWFARRDTLKHEIAVNEERITTTQKQLKKIPNSRALTQQLRYEQEQHDLLLGQQKVVRELMDDTRRFFEDEFLESMKVNIANDPVVAAEHVAGSRYLDRIRKEAMAFNNRFAVHNIQLKWNNTLRNVLIRYIQRVNQRRGFSYYMSQKAVRFLSDLVEDQLRSKEEQANSDIESATGSGTDHTNQQSSHDLDDDVQKLLKQLLNDKDRFFVPDETIDDNEFGEPQCKAREEEEQEVKLNKNYEAINNYVLRLIAPQIQFQSEKNDKAAVVLTASTMSMKILAIVDKTIAEDDVSALVQRRFSLQMHGAQFFYAEESHFRGLVANVLSQNAYGAVNDSSWPPWLPMESVYDQEIEPKGFNRIVDKTSIVATYTKHNNLRIKKNDRMADNSLNSDDTVNRTDSIAVHFPRFNLSANSDQYYALFTIAMDLLLYSEPLQKQRNEQIEKILLAADFSDLSGAPEMVTMLQQRIRKLNDFKAQFKLHAQRNDPSSKEDELKVEKKLDECEDELFFLMKSVATAQQKQEDRDSEVVAAMNWLLKADEILWHLVDGDKAFIDFGLSKASFMRTDNSDSSNFNTLEVEMMQGINLSPNPVFPDLFAPYFGTAKTVLDARRSKMVRIYWYMLEAIGGISICDHFEVNLFPLRLQMEHEVGKKLFAYVFPNKNKPATPPDTESESDFESTSSSDEDEVDSGSIISHESRSRRTRKSKLTLSGLKQATMSRLTHKSSLSRLRPETASLSSTGSAPQSYNPSSSSLSLARTNTAQTQSRPNTQIQTKSAEKKNGSADDLTAMLSRANQNMSLVYVKIPSVVLALSYKGAKAKNFTDVTDFVFKMPTIEYRNKTWSYLDLAEHLKREVIKAVLAHTGSLLRDKITHRRGAKKHQPVLARQLTSYKSFVPVEQGDKKIQDLVEERHREEQLHGLTHSPNRSSTTESNSMQEETMHHSGLFNNAIGRHIQHLSHLARHRDGLTEDTDESTLKKTRLLLGKFIDKAR